MLLEKPASNPAVPLVALLAFLGACAAPAPGPATPPPASESRLFALQYEPVDEATARALEPRLAEGVARVEQFFGAPFVHPSRSSCTPTGRPSTPRSRPSGASDGASAGWSRAASRTVCSS
jgi:hypothetical protein